MSFSGHIQNGVVVFDQPIALPEGTAVEVAVRETFSSDTNPQPTLWDRLKDVVGRADGLPPDASVRTDHYLTHGLPNE
jgi:hypothetical protein